jgi:Transposase
MTSKRKQYTSEFKFKAVLESFQRDTTIEAVCRKFDVGSIGDEPMAARIPAEWSRSF